MKTTKLKRKSFVDELQDNHMSGKGIRVTRESLEKAKSFAPKEKNAKDTRATPTWHITPVDFHKGRESYLSGVSIFYINK